jgi:hypothetical protein
MSLIVIIIESVKDTIFQIYSMNRLEMALTVFNVFTLYLNSQNIFVLKRLETSLIYTCPLFNS